MDAIMTKNHNCPNHQNHDICICIFCVHNSENMHLNYENRHNLRIIKTAKIKKIIMNIIKKLPFLIQGGSAGFCVHNSENMRQNYENRHNLIIIKTAKNMKIIINIFKIMLFVIKGGSAGFCVHNCECRPWKISWSLSSSCVSCHHDYVDDDNDDDDDDNCHNYCRCLFPIVLNFVLAIIINIHSLIIIIITKYVPGMFPTKWLP